MSFQRPSRFRSAAEGSAAPGDPMPVVLGRQKVVNTPPFCYRVGCLGVLGDDSGPWLWHESLT